MDNQLPIVLLTNECTVKLVVCVAKSIYRQRKIINIDHQHCQGWGRRERERERELTDNS